MKYLSKTFSVPAGGTDAYRENWERTFRPEAPDQDPDPDAEMQKAHEKVTARLKRLREQDDETLLAIRPEE